MNNGKIDNGKKIMKNNDYNRINFHFPFLSNLSVVKLKFGMQIPTKVE